MFTDNPGFGRSHLFRFVNMSSIGRPREESEADAALKVQVDARRERAVKGGASRSARATAGRTILPCPTVASE